MAPRRPGQRRIEPTFKEEATPKRASTPKKKAAATQQSESRSQAQQRKPRSSPPQQQQQKKRAKPVNKSKPKPSRAAKKQTLKALDAAIKGKKGANAQRPSWLWRIFRFAAYWSLVLGIWAFIFVSGLLVYYAAHLPPASEWAVPQRPPNVRILASNGTLIANRGDTGGEAVRLEQLPSYVPNAVIAIEDKRFRYHFGIDPIGLARALFINYTSKRTVQGGSTITQQLAKNLFLNPERTIQRKMQEVVMSLWLETNYTKDEILEMYLNRVYLGAGAYGIDAASRRYFSKSARLLSIAEASTIAGLLKAPSRYAPTRNPGLAESRSHLVIAALHEQGYINAAEAKDAFISPAKVAQRFNRGSENYVADYVMELLPSYVGRINEDIIVHTTIDINMQKAAEAELFGTIKANRRKLRVQQGAIVTLNNVGAIRAMVGGVNYTQSQFNRAVYARRQPGSAFKPFVFLTALERGMQPETVRQDKPISINGWRPKNYTKRYYGSITLTQALSESINTVAASLAHEVGPTRVVKTARRLGITSPLKANPSIALGTSEVTPLEIATAYVPFANGGFGVVPHVVRRIQTHSGQVVYSRKGSGPGRVIRGDKLSEINGMLAHTVAFGTGKKARLKGRPVAGKTGTSQNFRDAWFIGFTGSLTTAVWVGNDNNSPTNEVSGSGLPAIIWQRMMTKALKNTPVSLLPGVPLVLNKKPPETPAPTPAPTSQMASMQKPSQRDTQAVILPPNSQ
ncbi:transglycosylase domain-containing protein [Flexibacterium corallicola]|uniref:transglycosylase domain-containing protein n=1 Tax=Flexibacterium corallicola TaxID=3037259 RepID=UPI00286FA4C9|nr:PBP1A family penicillin-binding protein [Pseudovibrio sp. M1P-2-3]